MRYLLPLLLPVLALAQQTYNPPIRFLSGTAAPAGGDCDAAAERGALYIQTGDPATISTRVLACIQTGASTYGWALTSHKSGTAPPTDCVQGDTFFDTDATVGQNFYGCTATDTWNLLGDGGGGGAPSDASYIVVGLNGTLTAERTIDPGAGIAASDGGANGNYTLSTLSSEQNFLTSGALTCGASTAGKAQVHTTPLQYCDNAGTPALQYAAYGDSAGLATAGDSATSFFSSGSIATGQGGTGQTAATDDTVAVYNGTGTDLKALGNCTDTGGNHLNYTTSSNTFSCGTTTSSPTVGLPLFTSTATVTVTSTSEATLLGAGGGSLTIPANYFAAAGNSIIVDAAGYFSTQAVPGTHRVRLKFGSTVILDTAAYNLVGTITDGVWSIRVLITCRTTGASGTFIAESIFTTTGAALIPNEAKMVNTATITIDTTATQLVDLTTLFNTASNSISQATFTMYGPGGMSPSGTDTLTNKTIDVEGTGNSITTVSKFWLDAAACSGTTGSLNWDTLATQAPTATCTAGTTNTSLIRGVADFPDTGIFQMMRQVRLPSDWTGNVDVTLKWRTTVTANEVVWQIATVCIADAEVDDAAWNTLQTIEDTAKGTASQTNDASLTSITMTGCAANELLHFRVYRDSAHANDDLAATAALMGVELTLRRTQ